MSLEQRLEEEIKARKAERRPWCDLLERYGMIERWRRGEGRFFPAPKQVAIEGDKPLHYRADISKTLTAYLPFLNYRVTLGPNLEGWLSHAMNIEREKVYVLKLVDTCLWQAPLLNEVFRLAWEGMFREPLSVTEEWLYVNANRDAKAVPELLKDVHATWKAWGLVSHLERSPYPLDSPVV